MKFDIETQKDREKKKSRKDKKKIYTILILSFALIFIILIIAFVSSNKNVPEVIDNPSSTQNTASNQTPSSSNEEQDNEDEAGAIKEESNERPIAVMYDNDIGDAMHAGLQDSYLSYEIMINSNETGILAIFKDRDTSLIGPIIGTKGYFLDYVAESDAIYAHYGWGTNTKDEADIEKLKITNIDGLNVSEVYRRDTKSTPPHNVFTRMSYIKRYIAKKSITETSKNWKVLTYTKNKVDFKEVGYVPKKASKVVIEYSKDNYRSYSYDESKRQYLRFNNGKNQLDRKTEKQLHYKNVIIQRVPTKIIDREGNIEITTTGSGRAYYITNGEFLPINWSKNTRTSKTIYKYANGKNVEINEGNTFIQIVPEDCNITIE